MHGSTIEVPTDLGEFAEHLDTVAHAEQTPAEFWEQLLRCYSGLCGAPWALLLVRRGDDTRWKKVAAYREAEEDRQDATPWYQKLAIQAAEAPGEVVATGREGGRLAGVPLRLLTKENDCVAVFLFLDRTEPFIQEQLDRLQLVSAAPRTFQAQQALRQAQGHSDRLGTVIEWLVPVNEEDRFLAAALALCNGLATSLRCERVSLGWLKAGFVQLKVMSRTERFDRKMEAVQALETAMDEALEQAAVVQWPEDGESVSVVTRDHERFAKAHESGHVLSFPLSHRGEPLAVITCERSASRFSEAEREQLQLVGDLAMPRLVELERGHHWWGRRCADGMRRRLSALVGPDHTWTKLLCLGLAALLAFLIFFQTDYRVEGDFILRSDRVAYLTTPFDGYIEDVLREAPAAVAQGEPLLTLQTDELKLEEASELANLNAYRRQVERARASNQLAEMRIAEAQVRQAEAQLAIVRHRLDQAELRAPWDGVIIEGDLRELTGKPIQRGDPLYKLARLESLYVEAKIDERDMHAIGDSPEGEIAFVGQPKFKFLVRVVQKEAAAFPQGEGNVFQVRCDLLGEIEPWWRPGMTGVYKIHAGRRSLLWILTHRTVDFLRMWLWW